MNTSPRLILLTQFRQLSQGISHWFWASYRK